MTILTKNLMLGWFSCEANIVNHRKKKIVIEIKCLIGFSGDFHALHTSISILYVRMSSL